MPCKSIRQTNLAYTGETGGYDEIQTRTVLLDREASYL